MQQLSGLDGMFLSVDEAGTANAVMGGLMVFDRSDDVTAGGRARVVERISERLDALPPFRWVLTRAPIGLNNAYWSEVRRVDVQAHVREVHLEGDGSDRDLAETVARIMETNVPMDRPPWEYVVIHGLSGGRLAHLLRIHHGVVDGATVPTILDLLSDEPTVPADPNDAPGRRIPFVQGRVGAAARGLVGTVTAPLRLAKLQAQSVVYLTGRREDDGMLLAVPSFLARMLPGTLGRPVASVVNGRRRKAGKAELVPMSPGRRRPDSPFDGRITDRRTYAFADLPLADVKQAGKAFGATLNDAVVATCAGAVRRYMAAVGELSDEPLVVCVPASLRSGDTEPKDRWANHVSMFFAEFPTHLADPVARLEAVRHDLQRSKNSFDAGPTHLLRDVMRFIPQSYWNISVKLMAKGPDWYPPAPWNVVVSNVRGPAETVRVCGAEMTGYWPAAFLTPGVGLNITLQSYRDRIDFGFMGCPDITPDLWDFPTYMEESLAELVAAAAERTPTKSTAKKATVTKAK